MARAYQRKKASTLQEIVDFPYGNLVSFRNALFFAEVLQTAASS
jgi:hypothetical protein